MANPLGSAPGIMVGIGVGTAASAAIEPLVEPGRQKAWSNAANRLLDPAQYAALVAQGAIDLTVGQPLARREGFNEDQFNRLVFLAQRAPDLAITLELWRRGRFGVPDETKPPVEVTHALAKEQIETRYWPALLDLFNERLSAQAVALGIIRSLMKDPGFFPVQLETEGGVVPSYPVSTIDPIEEAQAMGFNEERLRVMVGSIGRPPGPGELARATYRKLIERPDFNRGILEGDTRPEWAQTFLDINREILTAGQYAELQLRGFLTAQERTALTDQHGMSAANSDLLYNLLGRSIPVHQITTGFARGGKYDGPIDTIPKAYLSSLQRGNLRPEYYNLAFANRYSLPSAFVFRALLSDGAITEAEGADYFRQIGWPPELADAVAKAYAPKGTVAKADPHIGKAQTQLWTAIHRSYIIDKITREQADAALAHLVPVVATRTAVLDTWDIEKQVTVKPLTKSQIKKAYTTNQIPLDDAVARLEEQGLDETDANLYLTQ